MAGYYSMPQCMPSGPAAPCIPPQILTCLLQDKDLGSGEQAKNICDVIVKIDKLCAALQNIKRELESLTMGNNGGDSEDCDPNCPGTGTDGDMNYMRTLL